MENMTPSLKELSGAWEKRTMDLCKAHSLSVSQTDDVFSLVRNERAAQKAEIVKMIMGMKRGKVRDEDKVWAAHYIGYDEALQDIADKLV